MMKKYYIVLLFLTAGLLLSSCGKKKAERTVVELAGPADMQCVIEGIVVKSTRFRLPPGKYTMRFSAPGYRSTYRNVTVPSGKKFTYDPELEAVRTAVLIQSTPAGAAVTMAGKSMGITPLVIKDLPAGEYRAELSMRGYAGMPAAWKITSERPVAVSVNLDSNQGSLMVTSTPSRARVIVDGNAVGETPFKLEREEGRYVIRIERAGCNPEERNVRITKGRSGRLHVKLGQKPGGLRVTSRPEGAELYLNGVKRGVTPCTVEALEPGSYEVKLVKAGYDALESRVQIVPAATDTKHFNLASSTGSVVFNVQPAGVEVFFNGRSLGKARALAAGAEATADFTIGNLAPGRYSATMFHSLGDPPHQKFNFTIRKGKKTILKSIRMWLANCEIIYSPSQREKGFLLESKPDYVIFSPEPGIQYRLERSKIQGVVMLKGVKNSALPNEGR